MVLLYKDLLHYEAQDFCFYMNLLDLYLCVFFDFGL
jgi:hypothetical protein